MPCSCGQRSPANAALHPSTSTWTLFSGVRWWVAKCFRASMWRAEPDGWRWAFVPRSNHQALDQDTLQATVPSSLAAGAVSISLSDPDGFTYSLDSAFTIN